MLIKDTVSIDPYAPTDEDLEALMWELEQLNEQNPKGNTQSWDL